MIPLAPPVYDTLASDISVVLTPWPASGSTRLNVALTFRGAASGRTRFTLPNHGDSDGERWRLIGDLQMAGSSIARRADQDIFLEHPPGAPVQIGYEVADGYGFGRGRATDPYCPRTTPAGVLAFGDRILALPAISPATVAALRWGDLPSGWIGRTSLREPERCRVYDLLHGVFVAGPRAGAGEALRVGGQDTEVVALGVTNQAASRICTLAGRLLPACERFWGSLHDFRLLVAASVARRTLGADVVARVLPGAAVFLSDEARPIPDLKFLVAHELTHAWSPARLAPDQPSGPRDYWFTEGFTDGFAARTLLLSGLWDVEAFVADLNRTLARYAASPVRSWPLRRILGNWPSRLLAKHLYDRGRLLSILWGFSLWRAGTGREGVRQAAIRASQTGGSPESGIADSFLAALSRIHRRDLRTDVSRYIEEGEAILLPSPCPELIEIEAAGSDLAEWPAPLSGQHVLCAADTTFTGQSACQQVRIRPDLSAREKETLRWSLIEY